MNFIKISVLSIVLVFTVFSVNSQAVKYKDGAYSATFDYFDGHGWKPQLSLTIKGGKITDGNFDYVNPKGELKTKDKNYETTMNKVNKTYPALYSKELVKKIIDKQAGDVDVITGATSSTKNFNILAKAILDKAAKGDQSKTVLAMNDTYTVSEKDFDANGYKATLSVTFENGKITKVEYDEFNKDKKSKKNDPDYAKLMKDKTKVSPAEAIEKLQKNLLEKQSADKIDTVSGATQISEKFKTLLKTIMEWRK